MELHSLVENPPSCRLLLKDPVLRPNFDGEKVPEYSSSKSAGKRRADQVTYGQAS
jgi:hypothetical protein